MNHSTKRTAEATSGRSHILSIPIADHAPIRHLELTYYADRFISKAQQQLTESLIDFFKSRAAGEELEFEVK